MAANVDRLVIFAIVAAVAVSGIYLFVNNNGLTAFAATPAAAPAEGKAVVNPLSSVRPLELQAAALRKNLVNIEIAEEEALLNATLQNSSRLEKNRIKNNYASQTAQKQSQLDIVERQIDSAYAALYRTYVRDNEALSKIALAQLATLVRQDYPDKTSTVVPIINLDCSGGLIEDGLLFKYADAWGSNNYRLAASEAGRIAHQFQCLSVSQTLRLDRVITRKIQVQENRFSGNAEAKKLFLAGVFQPLMLSMDANMHLNPESVVFAEQHRETFRSMFSGTSGEKLAQMGLWLMNRTNGNFEQFNLCTSGSCITGLDLVYSLQRKNLGLGDCKLGEMIKAGPIAGVGFACDREICDAALDLAQVQQILQDVQQTANGVLNPSQPLANRGGAGSPQNAAPRNQNGLPGSTPHVPNLGSGQQTQFGINFGDAQNICSKRRAQGRNAAAPPNPANAPCGVGANSLSGPRSSNAPFQCMKSGQTKSYYGIGESTKCNAGQAADGEEGGVNHASASLTETQNRENGRHETEKQLANGYVRDKSDDFAGAFHRADPNSFGYDYQFGEQAAGMIDSAVIARGVCSGGVEWCHGDTGLLGTEVGVYVDVTNIENNVGRAQGAVQGEIFKSLISGAIDFILAQRQADTRWNPATNTATADYSRRLKVADELNSRGIIHQCAEESCGCSPGQAEIQKLEQCFSTRNSAAPRNLREAAARRGPIRDPTGDEVGNPGSGNLPGIELSCVSGNRASGVPRTGCEAAIQCPEGSYAAGLGGASCSCRAVGYREGLSGNVRLPGGEQCPSGLCPGLQNPAQQANRNPAQQVNINNPGAEQNPAGQAANR